MTGTAARSASRVVAVGARSGRASEPAGEATPESPARDNTAPKLTRRARRLDRGIYENRRPPTGARRMGPNRRP